MAVLYFSLNANFQTCTSLEDRIAKIDAIIDELFNTALRSVANGDVIEYDIDTGQTKQKVQYSSAMQVSNAIQAYENIRQRYVNKLLGNKWKVVGEKNLRRGF